MKKREKEIDFNRNYSAAYHYDDRTAVELVRELNSVLMFGLIITTIAAVITSLLLIMVTKEYTLAWWPITVAHVFCKWASIIGWPIWLIADIVTLIAMQNEQRKLRKKIEDQ